MPYKIQYYNGPIFETLQEAQQIADAMNYVHNYNRYSRDEYWKIEESRLREPAKYDWVYYDPKK